MRIRLVGESFRPAVTHVVMWLRDHDVDIGCVQVTARRHPDGTALITARRVLPPPAAEDYLARRRRREAEESEREATTRSRNSVTILLEAAALEPGTPLRLKLSRLGDAEKAVSAAIDEDPQFGEAEWTGLSLNQALRWRRDGGLYACTPLVLKLLEDVGHPKQAMPGPQCWATEDGRSLAELAAEIEPQCDPTSRTITPLSLRDLIDAGAIGPGTRVRAKRHDLPGEGVIQADGTIAVDGQSFSPTAASVRVGGYGSGWEYWAVDTPSGSPKTLATIRRELG